MSYSSVSYHFGCRGARRQPLGREIWDCCGSGERQGLPAKQIRWWMGDLSMLKFIGFELLSPNALLQYLIITGTISVDGAGDTWACVEPGGDRHVSCTVSQLCCQAWAQVSFGEDTWLRRVLHPPTLCSLHPTHHLPRYWGSIIGGRTFCKSPYFVPSKPQITFVFF